VPYNGHRHSIADRAFFEGQDESRRLRVNLTIGGKWKWSAEIEGQCRSGMAVSRPAGPEKAKRAIDKALVPKKRRLQPPEWKGPRTEAALPSLSHQNLYIRLAALRARVQPE
jgi:hypothetical protein